MKGSWLLFPAYYYTRSVSLDIDFSFDLAKEGEDWLLKNYGLVQIYGQGSFYYHVDLDSVQPWERDEKTGTGKEGDREEGKKERYSKREGERQCLIMCVKLISLLIGKEIVSL